MPAPTSYTEPELALYLEKKMGATAAALGWTSESDYTEIITDTLLEMGVSDISTVTDIRQLRAVAQVMFWRQAADHTAGHFTFSADGGSYNREQFHQHCKEMLIQAEANAAEWLTGYQIVAEDAKYHRDPYADYDDALTDGIDVWEASLRS